eukprot:CAMPEP_0203637664 /NCGR_PEP_ID=MMETSP0088-20131115/3926_1 /ASSEMBLY_ACC=CAM_ASM_001087 /TAXON_ID=426623 /ORGANISM="Chaetoceros affinis, Strain CCMP159" /LENGTH=548 /DNA_ID=CAMNT_0050492151 /DNA_START=9 /DNA_END=1652 /DNA_ORIENTATION=+
MPTTKALRTTKHHHHHQFALIISIILLVESGAVFVSPYKNNDHHSTFPSMGIRSLIRSRLGMGGKNIDDREERPRDFDAALKAIENKIQTVTTNAKLKLTPAGIVKKSAAEIEHEVERRVYMGRNDADDDEQDTIYLPDHGYPQKGTKHRNTFKVHPRHVVLTGENTGVNFNVETVPEPLPQHKNKNVLRRTDYLDALRERARGEKVRLEAVSNFNDKDINIVSVGGNAFLVSCVTAFAQHLPLGLSPDHVWALITYTFAKHVDKHAEELRHKFVKHEGKKVLEIFTPATFQMSQMNDPDSGATIKEWEDFVFPEFSKQIKNHIGEQTHSLLVEDFTTSTAASRASNEIVLMSTMKNYFSYKMRTRCGIPNITLLGTEEDWVSLRNRTEALGKLMKEDFTLYWMPLVLPILDEFVASYRGNVNHGFWQSMVKLRNNGMDSGFQSFISGWIQILFPYFADGYLNTSLQPWEKMYFNGPEPEDFPKNIISSAPVLWDYWGTEFQMNFHAGMTAVSQNDADGMLFPKIGWYVSHAPLENCETSEECKEEKE